MFTVSDEEFADLVSQALDSLPPAHMSAVKNVAIVYADEPTEDQRVELKLQCDQTLFGLYEGIPLPQRGGGTHFPPDKITIFKHPMEQYVDTLAELKEQVRHTVWHEIAHYFGLDHDRIHELERPPKK